EIASIGSLGLSAVARTTEAGRNSVRLYTSVIPLRSSVTVAWASEACQPAHRGARGDDAQPPLSPTTAPASTAAVSPRSGRSTRWRRRGDSGGATLLVRQGIRRGPGSCSRTRHARGARGGRRVALDADLRRDAAAPTRARQQDLRKVT